MSEINPSLSRVDIESRIAAQSPPVGAPPEQSGQTPGGASDAGSFAQALRAAGQGITLSGHAQTRLASRQIDLSDGDFSKLSDAMDRAASKGARSSLVLMGRPDQSQVGLVVSIPNRTVITAVDTEAMKENVFTNIDSAVII